MRILPSSANVVVLASNYNPSIVSKEWLRQKEIFTHKIGNFVFTPVFSLVESETHSLMVDENRLQYTIKEVSLESLSGLANAAVQFVAALPETPYKGVGINYVYMIHNNKCDLGRLLKPDRAVLSKVIASDLEVGFRAVFRFEAFIVNLAITPSFGGGDQTQISFNFHSDAAGQSEVLQRLALQSKTLEKAEAVVLGVCENV